jgi:hypothetical protein
MAKVTLSLPSWKENPVAPATFEIPIKDAPPKSSRQPGSVQENPKKGGR